MNHPDINNMSVDECMYWLAWQEGWCEKYRDDGHESLAWYNKELDCWSDCCPFKPTLDSAAESIPEINSVYIMVCNGTWSGRAKVETLPGFSLKPTDELSFKYRLAVWAKINIQY